MNATTSNQLAGETSPYLLQHAENPVAWYPWCDEALHLARRANKPILLSIGYSACHWCHVMAHESFEDPETAEVMNDLFVNIKVDREERPDLDKIYQVAHAVLTRRNGGWPLTMFLTPGELVPFFGGTYFPREARHGLPGFGDVLKRVAGFFHEHPDEIGKQSEAIRQFFASLDEAQTAPEHLDAKLLTRARSDLADTFDARHGGFGRAPKFPHPTTLERGLRHWANSVESGRADDHALHVTEYTLESMAHGGIYDQLGGGFYRYSVDEYWMIPHFEKMLYDNGPLLTLYCDAWSATGRALFREIAEATAQWVMREMQSGEGGYYSALDADSEGVEGKFYRWRKEEVREVLDAPDYPVVAAHYGLDQPANFEGYWHLYVNASLGELRNRFGKSRIELEDVLERTRDLLFELREQRTRPGRDEKVLTAWNALMIKGMANAGRRLGRGDFIASAERALTFLRAMLWQDGRLLASYKDNRSRFTGYLDDYAFLIDALLELLQTRWRIEDLAFATRLADALMEHYTDTARGGFYFTADDHETLIHRPKPFSDEATPSGNGIAAVTLNRLGHLLGESRYIEAAERTLQAAANHMNQSPIAHATLLNALEEQLQPPQIVILRGDEPQLEEWATLASQTYHPRRLVFAIPNDAEALPLSIAEKIPRGKIAAYVCEGMVCQAPLVRLDDFSEAMSTGAKEPEPPPPPKRTVTEYRSDD